MKYFLKIAIGSFVSGIFVATFSVILGLTKPFEYWFFFGACCCFFSVGYVEGLDALFGWWRSQPKFKGFRYWMKKALFDVHLEEK